MGITLASNFDVNAALPLDSRMVVADLTARDAIVAGRRFQGMCVYVIADTLTYQLKTGILNADWVEYGGAGATITYVETFSGDNSTLLFTLSADPVAIENTQVYINGVYQQKTVDYTLSTPDIIFGVAPPLGTNNIEIVYATPTTPLVIPDGYIDTVKLADGAVTDDKIDSMDAAKLTGTLPAGTRATRALGTGLFEISKGSAVTSYSNSTGTFTAIGGTATLTTSGGPVMLAVHQNFTSLGARVLNGGTSSAYIRFKRDSTVVGSMGIGGTSYVEIPVSSLQVIDYPPAGTYVYSVEGSAGGSSNISLSGGSGGTGFYLAAYEL